jgi:hypothetical protein
LFTEYEEYGYVHGLNEGKDIGKTNGINVSIVQVRDWLKNNNHLWVEESFYTPQGDVTLIDKMNSCRELPTVKSFTGYMINSLKNRKVVKTNS